MYILGISSHYHDSAAALIHNGKVIAAAEEERFTRIKHDNSFPSRAIKFCLNFAGISSKNLDYIVYYEKPLLKFERIVDTFVKTYPFSLSPFLKGIPEWLGNKIKIEQIIRQELDYKRKLFFIPHHLSHASAAYFTSPFKKSAILTIDGVGEYQTTGLWMGSGHSITPLKSLNFPHSLGLFYSTFTSFLGMKVNEDEYKLMGLAAYGVPIYKDKIREIIDIKDDGSFKLNLKYFKFRESFTMWGKPFEDIFGKPRKIKDPFNKRHKDLAASIQSVIEEIYFKILINLYQETNIQNLCISGGVGLNSLANGKIYQNTPFNRVHIYGPAGDNGCAIGCALYLYNSILKKNRQKNISLKLGSKYGSDEIESALKKSKLKYKIIKNSDELIEETVQLLDRNKIIGWYQDRMEFGPRALGGRSILANPNDAKMRKKVNQIKGRELFRPFAVSVLQERVDYLFEVPEKNHYSPFMNFCFKVKKKSRKYIPGVVHKDSTCRIQTVNRSDQLYYQLIKLFYIKTGIPCLLNTSFNFRGEPIVESPEQALNTFLRSKLDYLIIGNFLITRDNQ